MVELYTLEHIAIMALYCTSCELEHTILYMHIISSILDLYLLSKSLKRFKRSFDSDKNIKGKLGYLW